VRLQEGRESVNFTGLVRSSERTETRRRAAVSAPRDTAILCGCALGTTCSSLGTFLR